MWEDQGQKDLERELKSEKPSTPGHWRESEEAVHGKVYGKCFASTWLLPLGSIDKDLTVSLELGR